MIVLQPNVEFQFRLTFDKDTPDVYFVVSRTQPHFEKCIIYSPIIRDPNKHPSLFETIYEFQQIKKDQCEHGNGRILQQFIELSKHVTPRRDGGTFALSNKP